MDNYKKETEVYDYTDLAESVSKDSGLVENKAQLYKAQSCTEGEIVKYTDKDFDKAKKTIQELTTRNHELTKQFSNLHKDYTSTRSLDIVKKNLVTVVSVAGWLGYLNLDEILGEHNFNEDDYSKVLKIQTKVMGSLAKAEKNAEKSVAQHYKVLRNALSYLITLDYECSAKAIASLLDLCARFHCLPLNNEVYLINAKSGSSTSDKNSCYTCLNYNFKIGYCFSQGLVAERINLPEIVRDPSGDRSKDLCTVIFHLPKKETFTFPVTRGEITPFTGMVMGKSPDFAFKKGAVSRAINICFASEFSGIYIPEEIETQKNIINIIDTADKEPKNVSSGSEQ